MAGSTLRRWLVAPSLTLFLALAAAGAPAQTVQVWAPVVIDIDPKRRFQQVSGFGASITDASAYLIQQKMTAQQREALLTELFAPPPAGLACRSRG